MVEVCGMTASAWLPKTLCRPPAIGSSAAADQPEQDVAQGLAAGDLRRPGADRRLPSGSAAAPDRWVAAAAATAALPSWPADPIV